MAVPFSNTKLRVPRGFQNILEGFSCEVLRKQPGNILDFAEEYFKKLSISREATGVDAAEVGAALEDRFYNNSSFKKEKSDLSDGSESKLADIKQLSEKGDFENEEKKNLFSSQDTEERKDEEDKEETKHEDKDIQNAEEDKEDEIEREDKIDDSKSEDAQPLVEQDLNSAASTIQAGFRGYRSRKNLDTTLNAQSESRSVEVPDPSKSPEITANSPELTMTERSLENEPSIEEEISQEELEQIEAAIKIQSGVRGYIVRRELQPKVKQLNDESETKEEQTVDQDVGNEKDDAEKIPEEEKEEKEEMSEGNGPLDEPQKSDNEDEGGKENTTEEPTSVAQS